MNDTNKWNDGKNKRFNTMIFGVTLYLVDRLKKASDLNCDEDHNSLEIHNELTTPFLLQHGSNI